MRSLIKFPGGKSYLNKWIISNFPDNYESMIYIELFGGGGNVLLNKKESIQEIYNDIDPVLCNLFYCLVANATGIIYRLHNTQYTKSNFNWAKRYKNVQPMLNNLFQRDSKYITDPTLAVAEIIIRRMSRGGLGENFAWSERLRGGQPGDVNAWINFKKDLPKIIDRLIKVEVSCGDFSFWTTDYKLKDNAHVLIYADPPYYHPTRVSKKLYQYEMSESDHINLAIQLKACKGKVIISGYPSLLYDKLYDGWRVSKKEIANHSGQTKKKTRKTECLWMNY